MKPNEAHSAGDENIHTCKIAGRRLSVERVRDCACQRQLTRENLLLMSKIKLSRLLLFAAISLVVQAQESKQVVDAKDPRARPFVYVMIASIDSDMELFKFAFSNRIRNSIKEQDWPKGLAVYQKQLRGKFGNYKISDIPMMKFQFSGNEKEGGIGDVEKNGKAFGRMRLIKEGGGWKFNER